MLGGNRLSCDGNGNNNDDPNNDSVSIERAMRTASSSYETISGDFDSSFTDARTWSGNSRLMEERLSGDRNDAVTWCSDDLENMNEDPLFNLDPYAYDGDKVTRGFVDSSAMTHDLFGFNIRDDADMWFAPKAPTFASYPMMDPAIVPVVPVTIEPKQISMSLKPPRAPDMLLSTACTVSGHDPQYIAGTIVNFFADLELLCSEFTEDKFEMQFLGFVENVFRLNISVRLYSTKNGDCIVELMRNDGCGLRFADLFCELAKHLENPNQSPSLPSTSVDFWGVDYPELDDCSADEWDWIDDGPLEIDLLVSLTQQSSPSSRGSLREKLAPKLSDIIDEVRDVDVPPLCAIVRLLFKDEATSDFQAEIVTSMVSLFARSREFGQIKCAHALRVLGVRGHVAELHAAAVSLQVQAVLGV
eukprot:GEMP01010425.1.p1 GENE.GEMP01010425.1~~GEMP01010425.1.p1  ORF type:complete len:416 (+),score=88.78 GEMP01010425.1:24-1271(+)